MSHSFIILLVTYQQYIMDLTWAQFHYQGFSVNPYNW